MTEGVAVLQAVAEVDGGLKFETQDYDWGSERYLRQGAMMPADALKVLETGGFNAILRGPGWRSAGGRPYHALGHAAAHSPGL